MSRPVAVESGFRRAGELENAARSLIRALYRA